MLIDWLEVADKVPEDGRVVILAIPQPRGTYRVCTGHLAQGMWYGYDDFPLARDPTHWMPLPDPPDAQKGR